MLVTSHIATTTAILLGANALGVDLDGKIVTISYAFGVGIDLDHILFYWQGSIQNIREYLQDRKNFKWGKAKLHSSLQEPFAALVALGISSILFLFNKNPAMFLPAVSLVAHIFMDSLSNFENRLLWPFSSKVYRGPLKTKEIVEAIWGIVISIILIFLLVYVLHPFVE